jgi:hypothetical protein
VFFLSLSLFSACFLARFFCNSFFFFRFRFFFLSSSSESELELDEELDDEDELLELSLEPLLVLELLLELDDDCTRFLRFASCQYIISKVNFFCTQYYH